MNQRVWLAAVIGLQSVWACPLGAAVWVVDKSGGGDYLDIQSALDAAEDADVVLVTPGLYEILEPIDINRWHDSQDPQSPGVKNVVLRSNEGPEVTTIDRIEAQGGSDRPSVILFQSGEDERSAIEGFTVTGVTGWVLDGGITCRSGSSPRLSDCTIGGNQGGGLVCLDGSAPRLEHCRLIGNNRFGDGGGVYCNAASPTLLHCEIRGNRSTLAGRGAGVYCGALAAPRFEDCVIAENRNAENTCGGVYCDTGSAPILTRCVITRNLSVNSGSSAGGVFCAQGSNPVFSDCQIVSNNAMDFYGAWYCHAGGVYCSGSSALFQRCLISGNLAGGTFSPEGFAHGNGGGVYCVNDSRSTFINCLVTGNSTRLNDNTAMVDGAGGGVYCADASPSFIHCTISGNNALRPGGGLYCELDAHPMLVNCIVWGNAFDEIWMDASSTVSALHSCIEGSQAFPGIGNTNLDPLFVEPGVFDFSGLPINTAPSFIVSPGDYNLQPMSSARDHGAQLDQPDRDIVGNPRPCGNGTDMGAHETCLTPVLELAAPDGATTIDAWSCEEVVLRGLLTCDSVVRGIQFGIAYDPEVLVARAVVPGESIPRMESGLGPEVWLVDLESTTSECQELRAGLTVSLILSSAEPPSMVLPPGERQEVVIIEYAPASAAPADSTTTLSWVGCLRAAGASEPTSLRVTRGTTMIEPLHSGVVIRLAGDCFRRGDCNADGEFDISDAMTLLLGIFGGGPYPVRLDCSGACDMNGDGGLGIADAIYDLAWLFLAGPSPPEPYPECGSEPGTGTCDVYSACP